MHLNRKRRKVNEVCPFCGEKMFMDSYKMDKSDKLPRGWKYCAIYCDNRNCTVQPQKFEYQFSNNFMKWKIAVIAATFSILVNSILVLIGGL